jgi:hypothetical protein
VASQIEDEAETEGTEVGERVAESSSITTNPQACSSSGSETEASNTARGHRRKSGWWAKGELNPHVLSDTGT